MKMVKNSKNKHEGLKVISEFEIYSHFNFYGYIAVFGGKPYYK